MKLFMFLKDNLKASLTIFLVSNIIFLTTSSAKAATFDRDMTITTSTIFRNLTAYFDFKAHEGEDLFRSCGNLGKQQPVVCSPEGRLNNDDHDSTAEGTLTWIPLNNQVPLPWVRIWEIAEAEVFPKCPPDKSETCGLITMLAQGTFGAQAFAEIDENQPFQLLPNLRTQTKLGLGDTVQISDSIDVGGNSDLLYNLNIEIALEENPSETGDPLVFDQKVIVDFTPGISNSLFTYSFNNSEEAIETAISSAFTYNSFDDAWSINTEIEPFELTIIPQQTIAAGDLTINFQTGLKDNANEVPEPLTILGSATALGIGALLKRESSKKKNKS